MSEVLKLTEFSKKDGVSEMDIGGGWIKARLDAKGFSFVKTGFKI